MFNLRQEIIILKIETKIMFNNYMLATMAAAFSAVGNAQEQHEHARGIAMVDYTLIDSQLTGMFEVYDTNGNSAIDGDEIDDFQTDLRSICACDYNVMSADSNGTKQIEPAEVWNILVDISTRDQN